MPAANAKGKYQPWYHESFISDPRVRRMSPLARKTYMTLLHEAFVCSARPYLPDDAQELELLADCTDSDEWWSIKDVVLGMFQRGTYEDQPVLINKRLVEDWNNLLDIREKRSEAGKASGEARRAKSIKAEHVFDSPEHRSFVPNKEVSKLSKESEVSEVSEVTEDGQDDMKSETQIQILSQQILKTPARFYGSTKDDLRRLERTHKASAVVRAFEEWANGLDEAPANPGVAFVQVADDLLSGETVAQQAAKAPEVVSLVRELTYLSDGKVKFADRQKPYLAALIQEYSQVEILTVFKAWLGDQDLSDPRKIDFAAKNFVECADALCYSARRKKSERVILDTERELAKSRLQAEAEAERIAAESNRGKEELLFDPLGDTISE